MKNQNNSYYNQVITDRMGREYKIKLPAISPEDFGRILTSETEVMFMGTFFKTSILQKKVLQAPVLLTKFADCYKLQKI